MILVCRFMHDQLLITDNWNDFWLEPFMVQSPFKPLNFYWRLFKLVIIQSPKLALLYLTDVTSGQMRVCVLCA